jgi:hypothetical protein
LHLNGKRVIVPAMRARTVVVLSSALLLMAPASRADYGDLPPQPGDADYVPPKHAEAAAAGRGAPSRVHFEIAASADYLAPPIRGGTNPFGLGFGGTIGLTMAHLYVGFAFVDYLGGTDVTQSDQSLLVGGELGCQIVLREMSRLGITLELRPSVGVGNAGVSHTDPALVANAKPDVVTTASGRVLSGGKPSDTVTVNSLYVRPKLAIVLRHGWHFVALEGDALILPSIGYAGADPTTWLTYGIQLRIGAHF